MYPPGSNPVTYFQLDYKPPVFEVNTSDPYVPLAQLDTLAVHEDVVYVAFSVTVTASSAAIMRTRLEREKFDLTSHPQFTAYTQTLTAMLMRERRNVENARQEVSRLHSEVAYFKKLFTRQELYRRAFQRATRLLRHRGKQ